MSLNQLTIEYLRAHEGEIRAFQAIEGTGTGEQWDAYFNAQNETLIALECMLAKTHDITLSMIDDEDEDNRNNVTSFFNTAVRRGGDVRRKAIEKAFELARLEWGVKPQK